MKIVVVSNIYPPFVRGGAEIVAQRMTEGLRDHLQHVTVFTTKPYTGMRSFVPERVTINSVPAVRFYPLNLYFYLNDFRYPAWLRGIWHIIDMFNVHSAFLFYLFLRKSKPDVVITHNLMGIGFLIPRVASLLGIRHIHVLHDVQLYNPSGIIMFGAEMTRMQKTTNFFRYPAIMQWLFKKTNVVISPSKFLLNFYTTKGYFKGSEKVVLPNPLGGETSEIRHTERQMLRLLYLGQLTDAKGVTGLIDTVIQLPRDAVELKIVGSGPLLSSLRNKAKSHTQVRFFGWLDRSALGSIFSDTDIVIVPTLCFDNSPTVVFEALMHGIPVIASDIGGIPEILTTSVNGWLYTPGDWSGLKKLLLTLIDNRQEVAKVATTTMRSVEHLTVQNYIERVLNLCGNDK